MDTSDYTYILPPEKIAFYPLSQRDASKLLVYKKRAIIHAAFRNIADHLPPGAFLFFNNTKVIPARLRFTKNSGAVIEIFLLNPILPSALLNETMASTQHCTWQCTIGNLKKWPASVPLTKTLDKTAITATLVDRNKGMVKFSWNSEASFAEVIRHAGETPLPPYIKRKAETIDAERYQTIYSQREGAVAAPTAGLHFTPEVFATLTNKNVAHDFLTLHVSSGTFQPIKAENPDDHIMHEEQVVVSRGNLQNLMDAERFIIAVGTTSMRTLESVYWYGAKLLMKEGGEFRISQQDPYTIANPPEPMDALKAVADYMDVNGLEQMTGETSIFIRPGYTFRICKGLVTNFHQPASTLILLVAAFVGKDWRRIYDEALHHDYRFLSYGDSSLLIP